MRVWISGAGGFVGTAVCRELEKREIDYIPFDRSIERFMDVRYKDAVETTMQGCTHALHLSGVLGTAELFLNWEEAVDVNIKGAMNVLNTCMAQGVSYTSITMPRIWKNLYQATKGFAQDAASSYHLLGLPVSHVRAFNVFGPGQKVGPGHPQKLVPTFAYNAWRDDSLPVWGTGTQYTDLVSVSDTARLLVDATQFGDDDLFDAGTGKAHTVLEIAQMIIDITNSDSEIEYLPMRAGEQLSDPPIARGVGWDKLDWCPTFNLGDFEDTILSYQAQSVAP